jgi:crotonobetainyl-CoA:carnitine CoA-transferase CaiB-like acyl-CoA transferase
LRLKKAPACRPGIHRIVKETFIVKPLEGIRILDLSAVISGPVSTAILADQGAEVIKVETPEGDLARKIGPAKGEMSAAFITCNRGKRSIVLDLKKEAAREVLSELVRRADALIENFRPGALKRLGFGQEVLDALNPQLVTVSITGFGQDGPYSEGRVYDAVIQAVSGMCASHRERGSNEPMLTSTLLCDKLTGLTAAQAITAGLLAKARTGKGTRIEVSMLDAALAFQWPDGMYNHTFMDDAPTGFPRVGATMRPYKTRDGYVTIMSPQQDEFEAMCRGFGAPEIIQDPRFATTPSRARHAPELRAIFEPLAAQQHTDECVVRMRAAGTPIGKVNEHDQVLTDAQVVHNGTVVEVDHGALGRVRLARSAARFPGDHPPRLPRAPWLGEHTHEVLSELGFDEQRIAALQAQGAIRVRPGTDG